MSKKPKFKPTGIQLADINKLNEEEKKAQGEAAAKVSESGSWTYDNILKIGKDGIKLKDGVTPKTGIVITPSDNSTPDFDKVIEAQQAKINFEDLEILGRLGQGASATVHKVKHKTSKLEFAQKRVIIDKPETAKLIVAEMKSLVDVVCPNVVQLYEAFYRDGSIYMILEYMNCGALDGIISLCKKIPENVTACMVYQILLGLKYLHQERHIVHRDFKPANVLVSSKGHVKISDLGMAGFKETNQTFQGTLTYMSPERIKGLPHSYDCDIWALGLSAAEMVLGRFPLNIKDVNIWALLKLLQDKPVTLPEDETSIELRQFVSACCAFESKDRASIDTLLKMDFITKNVPEDPAVVVAAWLKDGYIRLKREEYEKKKAAAAKKT